MSTLQLASATGVLVVEWNKYPPHFRVVADSVERKYHTEEAALRAAKRICRQRGITLVTENRK